ncbi:MAG: hypothetical protein Q8P45_01925 [Candidatus Harrisonbacteria bacterium]|nr:hypothetical protein [Candidatus Harrisonbacteria bacterium]
MDMGFKESLILGDQSPWAGGLLRWFILRRIFPKAQIHYHLHDSDTPFAVPAPSPRKKRGWVPYWAIAARNCFALDIPGYRIDPVMDSMQSQSGLSYLAGPSNFEVIGALEEGSQVVELTASLLQDSQDWLSRLCNFCGQREAERFEIESRAGVLGIVQSLAKQAHLPGEEIGTTLEIFAGSPPLLWGTLPPEYFWKISDGRRSSADKLSSMKDGILVPKGVALLLEFSARGWRVAQTACAYTEEILALRDKYLPSQKLRFLKVGFDWELSSIDPVSAQVEAYQKKKAKSGRPAAAMDEEALRQIRSYWRQRPTLMAYLALGGDLHPTFQVIDL